MTEDEMVGWHHRLNGHGLSKLWELVKEGERHQLGREELAEQPPATPPPCRQHIPTTHVRGMARHEGKLDCHSCGKVRNLARYQVHSVAQEFNVHLLCLALFRPKRKSAREE